MRALAGIGPGLAARSALMYALWLALVDNPHTAELVAGVPCALAAGALATAAARMRLSAARPRPSPAMLARLPRMLPALVTDTARLAVALGAALAGRPPRGRFRAVPFGATAATPADAARRALTEIAGSLGPNRVVVGVDVERGALLVHELVASGAELDPLRLG